MSTVDVITGLFVETCCNCGITFGFTQDFKNDLVSTGKSFYCPNGHPQIYTNSDASKIRQLQDRVKRLESDKLYFRHEAEIKSKNWKAEKTRHRKTKERIANGVCPCCHRSFVNLHNHMQGQHPDYPRAES